MFLELHKLLIFLSGDSLPGTPLLLYLHEQFLLFFSGLRLNITLRGNSLPDISKGRVPAILLLHLVHFYEIIQLFSSLLDCRLCKVRSCLSPRYWSNCSFLLRVWHKWGGQEIVSDDWMICNHELSHFSLMPRLLYDETALLEDSFKANISLTKGIWF